MELLIFGWSKRVTRLLCSGEFGPTLEDVDVLTSLPMFGQSHATCIVLGGNDKEKLKFLNKGS